MVRIEHHLYAREAILTFNAKNRLALGTGVA